MPELQKHRNEKTILPNVTTLEGYIEITAAGAINTQSGQRDSGVVWAKGAGNGEYIGTLHRSYRRYVSGFATVNSPTAATTPTAADGNQAFVQGATAAMSAGTTGVSTVTIQCVRTDTDAKANPTSGNIIHWQLRLSDSQRA